MKEKLLSENDIRKLHPVFRGPFGNVLIKIGMALSGMNKVNRVYDNSKKYEGVDFCKHLLDEIGVKVEYENIQVLDQFKDLPFITVSNHAYGHIDGIISIGAVGSVRPDYKMMVNFVLGMIDTMSMNFIAVNPYQAGKLSKKSSLGGIKECIQHLNEGHPLGFFPAGAVSKTKIVKGKMIVEDREWQPSVVKLIAAAKVPVIPIFFSGKNSWFFNFIDLVDWRLRSLRLGHEVTNKKGKVIHVRFGSPIMPDEIAKYDNLTQLGLFLKNRCYALAKPEDK